jgi:hypothetical protein
MALLVMKFEMRLSVLALGFAANRDQRGCADVIVVGRSRDGEQYKACNEW